MRFCQPSKDSSSVKAYCETRDPGLKLLGTVLGEPGVDGCLSTQCLTGKVVFPERRCGIYTLLAFDHLSQESRSSGISDTWMIKEYFKCSINAACYTQHNLIFVLRQIGDILKDKTYYINEDNNKGSLMIEIKPKKINSEY